MISSLIEKYHYLREIIYNKKISKRLGTVGEGSVIVRPCLLQGGALKEIHIGDPEPVVTIHVKLVSI